MRFLYFNVHATQMILPVLRFDSFQNFLDLRSYLVIMKIISHNHITTWEKKDSFI